MSLPIAEFATEDGNPGNVKRLTRLVVEYPGPHLPAGVTFVDTPGFGSLATAGAARTFAAAGPRSATTILAPVSATWGPGSNKWIET
jgi:hypothetical protein